MIPVWARFVGVFFCVFVGLWAFVVLNHYVLYVGRPGGASAWFRPNDFKCPTCGYNHDPFAPHQHRDDDAEDPASWKKPPPPTWTPGAP